MRRIDRTRKRDLGGAQQDRAEVTRLLVELGRPFGIELALLDIVGKQRIGRINREVVADGAVAAQDLVDHLLAIHGELDRHAQIVVVEGRGVAEHVEWIEAATRNVLDRHTGNLLDEIDDFGLDAVDHVHLASLQGGNACGRVVDDDDLDLVAWSILSPCQ